MLPTIPKWYQTIFYQIDVQVVSGGVYGVYMLLREELRDFLQVLFAQVMSKLC